jgi:hypothetical protein
MAERGRSRSPPGQPGSCAGVTPLSCHRGEQLEEAVLELTQGAAGLSVEVLQKVVPLVVQASAELRNAARADKLAILRAEGAFEEPAPSTPAGSGAGSCPSVAPTIPSPEQELLSQPIECSQEELLPTQRSDVSEAGGGGEGAEAEAHGCREGSG